MPIEETGSTTPQACTITLSKFPMTMTSNRSWLQQGHRGFAIEAMPKRSSAIEIAEMNQRFDGLHPAKRAQQYRGRLSRLRYYMSV